MIEAKEIQTKIKNNNKLILFYLFSNIKTLNSS
jgi:hypothetical protein